MIRAKLFYMYAPSVVPDGSRIQWRGMITLNESGVLLWKALEIGADTDALVKALTSEYAVEESVARADVEAFLEKLQKAGCLQQ